MYQSKIKKFGLLMACLVLLMVFSVGCIEVSLPGDEPNNKASNEVASEDKEASVDLIKEDLENYLNKELPPVFELENEALGYYDAVTGPNYTNDEDFYYSLLDYVLPTYQYFIDELELIRPQTKEVRDLHELYIEAANSQYAGFTIFLSGVEKQDFEIMAEGNEKLDYARKLIRQWEIELEELCKKHGVTTNLPGDFT